MNIFHFNEKGSGAPLNNSIFTEDNANGYSSKPEFKSNLELFGSDEKTRYKLRVYIDLFNYMKAGVRLTKMPDHTFNNGESGSWLALQIGRVKRNLFIPHFGDMKRLIDDYASGRLKIDKTLEEYYNEACEK